jgi:hypothetical protein
MPAEGHRWLGAITCEWKEAFPRPAGKQYSKCVSHSRVTCLRSVAHQTLPAQTKGAPSSGTAYFKATPESFVSPNGGEYHMKMNLAAHVSKSMLLH